MANTTKLALEASLKELLRTKPIDRITINDLTEHCGISRMTFYYHFKDIYDPVSYTHLDTTKEERIALIRSWQEPDDCVGGSGMDLFDMYDAYIRGEKEIAAVSYTHLEESERYCRKCELAKQYGGGLEEYLLRYLAQLTPEEQAEDVTYARRLACCGKCTWYGEHMCRRCV